MSSESFSPDSHQMSYCIHMYCERMTGSRIRLLDCKYSRKVCSNRSNVFSALYLFIIDCSYILLINLCG